jgi:general secretion pathway protein G
MRLASFHRLVTIARPGRTRRREGGFTLLEILVVIAILGLLATLAVPAVIRQFGGAKLKVAKLNIEQLESNLDLYKLDVGSYPTTEQGLQALVERPTGVTVWNGPYLKGAKLQLDPWNHPYIYREPSTRRGHDYDLCSGGANGVTGEPGGEGMLCNDN